jgi:hypothetical protein
MQQFGLSTLVTRCHHHGSHVLASTPPTPALQALALLREAPVVGVAVAAKVATVCRRCRWWWWTGAPRAAQSRQKQRHS